MRLRALHVKRPVAFGLSMVLAAVFLYLVGDRIVFLTRAERTTGKVSAVLVNQGSRKARMLYTAFSAQLEFWAKGDRHFGTVHAGWTLGGDQQVSEARYKAGDSVEILYNPTKPEEAYGTSFWDLWGTPALVLFFQVNLLLISIATRPEDDGSIISLGVGGGTAGRSSSP